MKFDELFEQYGKPVTFAIPKKIAATKPRPDYRQRTQPMSYRVDPMPSYMGTFDQPDIPPRAKTSPQDKPLPIRVGKELIKPNDPRHAAIMSLLSRQQRQP